MNQSDAFDLNRLKIDRSLKTPPRRNLKPLLLIGCIALLGIGGWLWSRGNPPGVSITEVLVQNTGAQSPVLNASGYVTPRRRATVASKTTGRVSALYIDEGMAVKDGEVLALLDAADAIKGLDSARADLAVAVAAINDLTVNREDAARKLTRQEALVAQAITSRQDLETAQALVASFDARINLARKQVTAAETKVHIREQELDNYTIRAPFAGMVVSKDAQLGEMVSPLSAGGGYTRTGIATLVDMASLEIEVDINESHIAGITVGQKVIATLDAYPDWHLPARVRTVIPTADREKATVKVRITFDQLDPKILPDMGIKVAFLEEEKPGAPARPRLLVNSSAVVTQDDRTYAFVYKEGAVERREIKTGKTNADMTEILSGLLPGDRLVDLPPQDLKDGDKVVLKEKGAS